MSYSVEELFGFYNLHTFKIFSIKTPIPGYKPICMYPGMRTDQKVTQNVLAVKNNFIAVSTGSFLLFTTSRAQNLTFFTGSVFFPGNAGFEKGVFV
jgi:hypothetical protein